ncbi:hypothetical protein IV203_023663 [Nitzschia inconspicua]|uniref:SET domain-containing protein n=1 Tax=Nitzschia inconspicua TaxID=303405 RepID=A0A9K3PCA1_9STRA|nr:hypothetical protein IV203_023663 [Nitzschia inconspicua]
MLTALTFQEKLQGGSGNNGDPIENKKKQQQQQMWIVFPDAVSHRSFLFHILLSSIVCFWMGRIVSSSETTAIPITSSDVLSSSSSFHSHELPPQIVTASPKVPWNYLSFLSGASQNNHCQQQQPPAFDEPSLNGWISNGSVTSTSATTTAADNVSKMSSFRNVDLNEEEKEEQELASRMQYFQELVVHPVLLTMKEDHQAERIAIILDDDDDKEDMLTGLVQQILNYRSIRHIFVVKESLQDCQDTWTDLSQLVHSSSVVMECVSKDSLSSSSSFQVDVVLILDDCNVFDNHDHDDDDTQAESKQNNLEETFRLWFQHLSPGSGSLVTCLGETLPLHHPRASLHHEERLEKIDALEDADFQRIVEYDIRLAHSRYAQSIVVAWKDETSLAQWRMNEAQYALRVHSRLVDPSSSLAWFDSATMVSLKYPSKHSALRFCEPYGNHLAPEDICDSVCSEAGHGYDPYIENIPVEDLYVGKSQAGDHSGRGVFTKVDIPTNSYLGLETTVHSIIYEWPTSDLYNNMLDFVPVFANTKGNVVFVFAEAYGYAQEPWNMPQETVMSHLLNFLNHGCNGTANSGDFTDVTEFTINLDLGHIPDALQSKVDIPYVPHFDRDQVKFDTMTQTFRPINAGEEIYDNYMSFGGESHFRQMVETLRQECSGSFGMVEQYQKGRAVVSDIRKVSVPNVSRGGTDEL